MNVRMLSIEKCRIGLPNFIKHLKKLSSRSVNFRRKIKIFNLNPEQIEVSDVTNGNCQHPCIYWMRWVFYWFHHLDAQAERFHGTLKFKSAVPPVLAEITIHRVFLSNDTKCYKTCYNTFMQIQSQYRNRFIFYLPYRVPKWVPCSESKCLF